MYLDLNHLAFQQHLRQSGDTVWFIAKWLWFQGNTVTINRMRIAPEHQQWKQYADHGDIEIIKNGFRQRIEVKGLQVNFTSKRDWPFPDFIVCAKHSFDNAKPIPSFYFIVSNDRQAMAIVDTKSYDRWTVSERFDSRYYDIKQNFYICPLDLIHWKTL